jgi:hypothetical protein
LTCPETPEWQQQVNDARRHLPEPRFEFRQQFATFLQASGFKAGVVSHHRAGFRQGVAQLAHEFRARVSRAFGEKLAMFRRGIFGAENVQ